MLVSYIDNSLQIIETVGNLETVQYMLITNLNL